MDYQCLTEFIDMGVEKASKHHKFNNDEISQYILLSRIQIQIVSVL
jgi:hypothetical protein